MSFFGFESVFSVLTGAESLDSFETLLETSVLALLTGSLVSSVEAEFDSAFDGAVSVTSSLGFGTALAGTGVGMGPV